MRNFDNERGYLTILEELERLRNTVDALSSSRVQAAEKNYESLCMDAALRGERLAVMLREMLFATTKVQRVQYLPQAADTLGVSADFENGILHITLPCQLPKRRWKNGDFLTQPVMAALSQLAERVELPRYEQTAICFVHVVGRDVPLRQVRDHDNIETKQIIDVLSAFVLLDDNGLLCETHQWTERGDSSRTEVYVMKKEDFLAWVLTRKGG